MDSRSSPGAAARFFFAIHVHFMPRCLRDVAWKRFIGVFFCVCDGTGFLIVFAITRLRERDVKTNTHIKLSL